MLIGVTGQIGSGKSEVARLLKQRGALIIDADVIGKKITGSPRILAKLVKLWGRQIRSQSGKLRSGKVARIVFADNGGRELMRLNKLVQPGITREIGRLIKSAQQSRPKRPIVIDAALLPDWPNARKLDLVILVTASRQLRLRRLVKRGLSAADARLRIRSQRPLEDYRRISQITIKNNSSRRELGARVNRLWRASIHPRLES